MAKIRGFAIRGLLKYVKSSRFEGGIPAILNGLSGDVAATFDQAIERGAWYPYEVYAELLREVDEKIGEGDLSLMVEVGHFTSRHEGETMFELFSGATTVERLLENVAPLWQMYCDTGRFETPEIGPGFLVATLEGFPDVAAGHCHLLTGWIEGMGLAVGTRTSKVEKTRCVHRGDDCCEYRGHWTGVPPRGTNT